MTERARRPRHLSVVGTPAEADETAAAEAAVPVVPVDEVVVEEAVVSAASVDTASVDEASDGEVNADQMAPAEFDTDDHPTPPTLPFVRPPTAADDAHDDDTVVALETRDAGMTYGGRWALQHCSLRIPQGSVVAVVGKNGAGKTTLLQMLVGLSRPTAGTVEVYGRPSWPANAGMLAQVGFVAQEKPLYRGLRVSDLLRLGARLNPQWDKDYASTRLAQRGVPLNVRVGRLSGGQRTQVALVMALAKRPSVLVLDEPLSDLDPLARLEVLGALMEDLAERDVTVVLSSHVLSDLRRVCDWLVLIDSAQVRLSEPIDSLIAEHRQLSGPSDLADGIRSRFEIVAEKLTDRQASMLIRPGTGNLIVDPAWEVREPELEELVFAYMTPESAR